MSDSNLSFVNFKITFTDFYIEKFEFSIYNPIFGALCSAKYNKSWKNILGRQENINKFIKGRWIKAFCIVFQRKECFPDWFELSWGSKAQVWWWSLFYDWLHEDLGSDRLFCGPRSKMILNNDFMISQKMQPIIALMFFCVLNDFKSSGHSWWD